MGSGRGSSGDEASSNNDADDLSRIYYLGVASTLECERDAARLPGAPKNATRVFVVGAGSNGTTNFFFWDAAYAATAFTLLDPSNVRAWLLQWLEPLTTVRNATGWGIDFFSGRAVGNHYAADDFSLFKLCLHYAQQTGDFAFLEETVRGTNGTTVLGRMQNFALAFEALPRIGGGSGGGTTGGPGSLADYGPAKALLECVPTYQHGVAAFNAASVWMLEQLAGLLEARNWAGDGKEAVALRAKAGGMAQAVLGLYEDGEGVWNALYPNGTRVPVRHVIDFSYMSEFMHKRLTPKIVEESTLFFEKELATADWMRALSLSDPAASASDRTDHGPYGSYDGWLPLSVAALARGGKRKEAVAFLKRTAAATRLGPYGQAHGVRPSAESETESSAKPFDAVAYKPFEFTLYNELTGLDFVDAVVTALFGLQPADAPKLVRGAPPVAAPGEARGLDAWLLGVRWQGKLYDAKASAEGVRWERA